MFLKRQDLMCVTVPNKMFWKYRGKRLYEVSLLLDVLGLREISSPVICAVGAGGKTSTLHRIADEYVCAGRKVCVVTTTHIIKEEQPYFLSDPTIKELEETMEIYGQVWAGVTAAGGKLQSLSQDMMSKVMGLGVPILIESDGARRLPVKVPDVHEPVIDRRATHVLSLYGLDAVGKQISDVCFRSEKAEMILKKKKTEIITPDDIVNLAFSNRAGRKGCPDSASYTVILNKADNEMRIRQALEICAKLNKKGIDRIIVTTYAGDGRG